MRDTAAAASGTNSTMFRTALDNRDMTSDAGTPLPATSPKARQVRPSESSITS